MAVLRGSQTMLVLGKRREGREVLYQLRSGDGTVEWRHNKVLSTDERRAVADFNAAEKENGDAFEPATVALLTKLESGRDDAPAARTRRQSVRLPAVALAPVNVNVAVPPATAADGVVKKTRGALKVIGDSKVSAPAPTPAPAAAPIPADAAPKKTKATSKSSKAAVTEPEVSVVDETATAPQPRITRRRSVIGAASASTGSTASTASASSVSASSLSRGSDAGDSDVAAPSTTRRQRVTASTPTLAAAVASAVKPRTAAPRRTLRSRSVSRSTSALPAVDEAAATESDEDSSTVRSTAVAPATVEVAAAETVATVSTTGAATEAAGAASVVETNVAAVVDSAAIVDAAPAAVGSATAEVMAEDAAPAVAAPTDAPAMARIDTVSTTDDTDESLTASPSRCDAWSVLLNVLVMLLAVVAFCVKLVLEGRVPYM